MSERMTSIDLPGVHYGFQKYGRAPAEQMIAELRSLARRELEQAQAVLDAADEDFRIHTFLGPIAQRNREVIQEGRRP